MAKKELDRFDTKARKNIQIKTKLTALIAGVIILSAVLVMAVALVVFERQYVSDTEDDLQFTSIGMHQMLDDKTELLRGFAGMMAGNQQIKDSLVESDYNTIKTFFNTVSADIDFSILALTDRNGIVIPNAGYNVSSGLNLLSCTAVSQALKGSSNLVYEGIDTLDFAAVYARPLLSNGMIIGSVVCAYNLSDANFVTLIKKSFDVECTVFNGSVRASSSIAGVKGTEINNSEIEKQVLKDGRVYLGKNKIKDQDYYSVYQPLKDDFDQIRGMIFVAKSVSAVEAIKSSVLIICVPIIIIVSLVLVIFGYVFVNWLMWRISNVTNFLKELESGDADLTKRCKLFIRDEIGYLIIHFDLFLDKMQQIIKELKDSKNELSGAGANLSESTEHASGAISRILSNIEGVSSQISNQGLSVNQTADAVNEISDHITSLNNLIESQYQGVEQASSAVEEMIGNISSVNSSVEKMVSSFEVLSSNSQSGYNKQQSVNDRIKQIENQSEMLQEANLAISNIAEQTNLLAMNAAIEAAHAGDAGKGFSVVADEIRKLSETSSEQSKTIGEQLNKIKDSITEVVSSSNESSDAFASVSTKIKETDEIVMQIRAAMEEQTAGSRQIGAALKEMNNSTMEVKKASLEMATHNEKIMHEVRILQDVSQTISESVDDMTEGANLISESGSTLNAISGRMQSSIEKIGNQIDLFKI
ncbi:MAG: cache domain-containing protein [Treponema sp.]|nr:cache domain-containing protein [Treponema sp.]